MDKYTTVLHSEPGNKAFLEKTGVLSNIAAVHMDEKNICSHKPLEEMLGRYLHI